VSGFYSGPEPCKPMKGIATTAITHPGTVTPGMLVGISLTTGCFLARDGNHRAVSWSRR